MTFSQNLKVINPCDDSTYIYLKSKAFLNKEERDRYKYLMLKCLKFENPYSKDNTEIKIKKINKGKFYIIGATQILIGIITQILIINDANKECQYNYDGEEIIFKNEWTSLHTTLSMLSGCSVLSGIITINIPNSF